MELTGQIQAVNQFSYWDRVFAWIHQGKVRTIGAIAPNLPGSAQVILPAGGLPNELRPASPVSVPLTASAVDSGIYYDYGPAHIMPLSFNELLVDYPSTVYPDGSWTLDSPISSLQFRYLVLLVAGTWTPVVATTDAPIGGSSFAPLLDPAWENIDAEYVRHGDTAHLRGSIRVVADQTSNGSFITRTGLPNPDDGTGYPYVSLVVEATASGFDEPAEVTISGGADQGAELVFQGIGVPTSRIVGGFTRVAGGTYEIAPPPNSVFTFDSGGQSIAPDLTGTDWRMADTSYPFFSIFGPGTTVQWRTPWWEWTVPGGAPFGGETGFAPGPVVPIPAIPSVDLGTAISTGWDFQPEWVTIQFHCDLELSYIGWDSLAAAQADAFQTVDFFGRVPGQNPQPPYPNAHRASMMAAVTPRVSGVGNRQFASGTFDSNGPFPSTDNNGAWGWDPYSLLGWYPSVASCYLAPVPQQYNPRKVIEPAGMEHAQLLWRPADVGMATVDVLGEAQGGDVTCYWTVTPFWESPDDYLIAGDTLTFTQRSWYPIFEPPFQNVSLV